MLIGGAPADCVAICMRYRRSQKVGEGRLIAWASMGCRNGQPG
jgi:hypothetical protein